MHACRLPSLNDIKTTVPGPLPLTPLGTLLYSMHKQLKSLHSLSLVVQQQGCAGAERVWQALGRFTQLTALVIEFGSEVSMVLDKEGCKKHILLLKLA